MISTKLPNCLQLLHCPPALGAGGRMFESSHPDLKALSFQGLSSLKKGLVELFERKNAPAFPPC
jgi:hypothetical protein